MIAPIRFWVFTIAVLSVAAAGAYGAARADSGSPVVADCASPRLPADLLDGPVPPVASPLPEIAVKAKGVTLRLAVADDDSERELGLMCVTKLRAQRGMIFVFPQAHRWDFWMKNTLVPLDMLWLDERGTITRIWPDVPAATRTTPDADVARRGGDGLYVVELPDGEAAADHLVTGERLLFGPLRTSQ